MWVQNPFQGFPVGWTWGQHVAAGYQGGTDYIFYPSDGALTAAADGVVRLAAGQNGFTPGSAIILTLADGRSVNYREVASASFTGSKTVRRGDVIGQPNRSGRWPHIDATVNGVRVPFEPLVNVGLDPSGITQEDSEMISFLYAPSVSWQFVVQPGLYIKNAPSTQANVEAAAEGKTVYTVPDIGTLDALMWNWGFEDQFGRTGQPANAWALLQTLANGGTLYTTAWKNAQAGVVLTAAQIAAIAAKIPAPDLSSVNAGIVALATALGTDVAAIQTAIAATPAAVVKSEGSALSNG